MNHWMPAGWYINSHERSGEWWTEIQCHGSPVIRTGNFRRQSQSQVQAIKELFTWLFDNLDCGWTEKTGNRVHLRVKGFVNALCGSRLQEGPDINKMETPPCGKCDRIQKTIERITGKDL